MTDNLVIENAEIVYTADIGASSVEPKFGVVISPELADELKKEGWNVRKAGRPDTKGEFYFLMVRVPKSYGIVNLYEVRKHNVDIVIRPYAWKVKHLTGLVGYLQSIELKEKK